MTVKNDQSNLNASNKPKKKTYQKPQIKSQKILEAGLTTGCNGTPGGGRKVDIPTGCTSGKLLT